MDRQRELIAAYMATRYEVETPDGLIVLRIGARSAALAALLERSARSCATYITAWNPGSIMQDVECNELAHGRLVREIESRGYPFHGGFGRDPNNVWVAERSVLVLGMSFEESCDIGRRFGQAAIVVAGETATPALVWLGLADA